MRYMIKVSNGKKLIKKLMYNDYAEAMEALDTAQDMYTGVYTIEFKDAKPFGS